VKCSLEFPVGSLITLNMILTVRNSQSGIFRTSNGLPNGHKGWKHPREDGMNLVLIFPLLALQDILDAFLTPYTSVDVLIPMGLHVYWAG